ncbi:MAG: SPASM domain-containing protein [Spirochaetia bacterium]|nr:SPASM domain-containing protein [Spirochaetia bacterium]
MKKYKKAYIEILNTCNLACAFCPKTERKPAVMENYKFIRILEQIKGRVLYLYLHVMGEPLMHPKLGEFLDACEAYDQRVNLTTNGTLISKAGFLLEKPALRQVSFSLHSHLKPGKEQDRYIADIFDFAQKAADGPGIQVALRLWNHGEGGAARANEAILPALEQRFNPGFKLDNRVTHVRGVKIAPNIFLYQAEEFKWPALKDEIIPGRAFCYGLREQFGVLVDGTVVPCCLDKDGEMALGNVYNEPLETILSSKRARAIREGFSKRQAVEELCKRCTYRMRFEGK